MIIEFREYCPSKRGLAVSRGELNFTDPAYGVFAKGVWLFDHWLLDLPPAFQAKFAHREFEMTHGDAHINPLQIRDVQDPERKAVAVPTGALHVEVPGTTVFDNSPRLLV